MPKRARGGEHEATEPDHDVVTDTGVEGGVDAPNEDLDVGDEPAADEPGSES